MKMILAAMLAASSIAVAAQDNPAHLKSLVEQHKAIANAHQAAAQCLTSGRKEEACHDELAKACRGLPTIGKLCGMSRHRH